MSSPGASTPADASTLGTLTVTALNVGMMQADSFKSQQKALVARLARHVLGWLDGPGAAVVGLNEIHSTIAEKLKLKLVQLMMVRIQIATCESNSLVWRAPQ